MIVDGGDQCSLIVGVRILNERLGCFNIDFDHIFHFLLNQFPFKRIIYVQHWCSLILHGHE